MSNSIIIHANHTFQKCTFEIFPLPKGIYKIWTSSKYIDRGYLKKVLFFIISWKRRRYCFRSIKMWMIMKYIYTSYIWWGLYKTFLNVAVHELELMEPARTRTTKELFIVLLLLEKSFNIIVYLIKVISLRIAQNTKFRKFWDGPWIRKRIIFSIQVSLFSVRWRTFLSTWRTQ